MKNIMSKILFHAMITPIVVGVWFVDNFYLKLIKRKK